MMKKLSVLWITLSILTGTACSKKDKDEDTLPTTEGITAKVNGDSYVGKNLILSIDSPSVVRSIGVSFGISTENANDNRQGMLIHVELKNNQLVPGTYPLKPRSDGSYAAQLFFYENLGTPQSASYGSYYVDAKDQDGQVVISTVDQHQIVGTYRGKVLTKYGPVPNTIKTFTEGKIFIKF